MSDQHSSTEDAGHVRPVARHDLAVLADLVGRLARQHGDCPHVDVARLEADLFGPLPWIHGLVAERWGFVVGYALLFPRYRAQFSQRGLDLHHLYLIESARGMGLGRKLVDSAAAFARAQDCAFLTVGAHPDNARAQRFYEDIGFARRETTAPAFAMELG